MRANYPLILDVADRLIVIVGGGNVACRKVKGLLEAGATRIRVISPEFLADFPDVEKVKSKFEPRHLDGAALVFAATDSNEVNDAVVEECHLRNIWVNRADSQDGDFTTPAMFRKGAVTIAVSAAGAPALAAAIRDGIAHRFDPRWARMAEAMQTLRPELIDKLPPGARRAAMLDLAGEEAMALLDAQGYPALKTWISQRYPHK